MLILKFKVDEDDYKVIALYDIFWGKYCKIFINDKAKKRHVCLTTSKKENFLYFKKLIFII